MHRPEILPENYLTWFLMEQFGPYFFDGMGGISAAGIQFAFQTAAVPDSAAPILARQIGVFLAAFRKAQHEQQDNHRTAVQG